jgi:hypothetical protein
MSKFEFSKKTTTAKNGTKIERTIIKAKNEKNLITYKEVNKFVKKLEESGVELYKLKIVGHNRIKPFTIKSEGEDYDDKYMENKPSDVKTALDGFYEVIIINVN